MKAKFYIAAIFLSLVVLPQAQLFASANGSAKVTIVITEEMLREVNGYSADYSDTFLEGAATGVLVSLFNENLITNFPEFETTREIAESPVISTLIDDLFHPGESQSGYMVRMEYN